VTEKIAGTHRDGESEVYINRQITTSLSATDATGRKADATGCK
jgi:hypothetical protein